MNLLFASADDPLSHVVPHALHHEPLFSVKVGGPETNIPALFIKDGVYDFYITNHLMMTAVSAVAVILVFSYVASKIRVKGEGLEAYQTKGRLAQMFETICWFIRDEVVRPNLHEMTDKYIKYIWTVFFFILFANILGLIPFGSGAHLAGLIWSDHAADYGHFGGTATSNLSLNAMLAICSFIAILFIGIRETGAKAFFSHFNPVGWDGPKAMSLGLGLPLYVLEWLGLLIKCVVLAMRLFGTMMAGHLVVAAIVGLVFTAAAVSQALGYGVGLAVVLGCIVLTLLELFICMLQAFIFTFLTVLFIATVAAHHGDHGHEHDLADDPFSDESQMDLDKLIEPSRLAGLADAR